MTKASDRRESEPRPATLKTGPDLESMCQQSNERALKRRYSIRECEEGLKRLAKNSLAGRGKCMESLHAAQRSGDVCQQFHHSTEPIRSFASPQHVRRGLDLEIMWEFLHEVGDSTVVSALGMCRRPGGPILHGELSFSRTKNTFVQE